MSDTVSSAAETLSITIEVAVYGKKVYGVACFAKILQELVGDDSASGEEKPSNLGQWNIFCTM